MAPSGLLLTHWRHFVRDVLGGHRRSIGASAPSLFEVTAGVGRGDEEDEDLEALKAAQAMNTALNAEALKAAQAMDVKLKARLGHLEQTMEHAMEDYFADKAMERETMQREAMKRESHTDRQEQCLLDKAIYCLQILK